MKLFGHDLATDGDDWIHAQHTATALNTNNSEGSDDSHKTRAGLICISMLFHRTSFLAILIAAFVLVPLVVSRSSTTATSLRKAQTTTIKGYIDGVRQSNDGATVAQIFGWACQQSVDESVRVDIYSGGTAGSGGRLWKSLVANQSSESAVAGACGASGRNYRFSIPITVQDAQSLRGQSIYVYGIRNGDNGLLHKSGDFRFPAPPSSPASQIKGHIDSVSSVASGDVLIQGWACQTGVAQSLQIHIYAGGPSGRAGSSLVQGARADRNSESAVASACGTSFTKYRFVVTIPSAKSASLAGKKVFIHGISTKGTPNLTIAKSGDFTFPSAPVTPSKLSAVGYSNPATKDIIIPKGSTVTIDTSIDVGLIRIEGKLLCPSGAGVFEIRTEGIVVAGSAAELVCGASPNSFSRARLSIVLKGNRDAQQIYSGPALGSKAIVATDGGVIRLHGEPGREGFTYLQQTAQPGATTIRLAKSVQWKLGDQVVIAPTDFSPLEAEQRTIVSVNGNVVTLDRGLSHKHWGATEVYNNGNGLSWTLDERAAVFVINRSIKIESEDDSLTRASAPLGGHFIVRGGAKAFIDNIEFTRMGQAGKMGRYPFHWHKLGSVAGQYIQNSSVHHSFQRCIVIHQSRYAKVLSNTCFDHFGHGYFMEDGNEVKNQLIGNLGVLSRKPTKANALLTSDITGNNLRFAPTSTFWVSHPDNLVRDNVAAGSEGSGFWMAFVQRTEAGVNPQERPLTADTWVFSNNKAHSCLVGITHDGAPTGSLTGNPNNSGDRALADAHYSPQKVPVFSNLVAFKCSEAGIYFRGTRATYRNAILADNKSSVFMAYDQEMIDTLVVGESSNRPQTFTGPYFGALVYDGPLWLERVHFEHFSKPNTLAIEKIGAAQLWTNQFRELSFGPNAPRRINSFRGDTGWSDEMCSAVHDVDGSLTGKAGRLVVPDHPWNSDPARCAKPDVNGIFTSLVCNYDVTHLCLQGNNLDFTSTRKNMDSGKVVASIAHTRTYRNKFSMIQDGANQYGVGGLSASPGSQYTIFFFARTAGISSPVVQWEGFGRCTLLLGGRALAKQNSLPALERLDSSGYFVEGSDLFVKFRTDQNDASKRSDSFSGRGTYVLRC